MRRGRGAFAATVALCACSAPFSSSGGGSGVSFRVVHEAPTTPTLDVVLDDHLVSSALAFQNATAYVATSAGTHRLALYNTRDADTAFASAVTFSAGTTTTLVVDGPLSALALGTFADTNDAAPAGKARLRVIDAAATGDVLDEYLTDSTTAVTAAAPTFTGITLNTATPYVTLDSGVTRIRFTTHGTTTVVLDVGNQNLPSTSVRTVIVREIFGGGEPLRYTVLSDQH